MDPFDPDYNNPNNSKFSTMEESYIDQIRAKYDEERTRRLRPDGNGQYSDIEVDARSYSSLDVEIPPCDEYCDEYDPLTEVEHQRVVIIGAGFGGLLHAVRLLQTGKFVPGDIMFLDAASGFGGTWCWNDYPGLMCDVESYIYLPLLEETGYMPSHKYVSGVEIRDHACRIASMFGLYHRGLFCTSVAGMVWDEEEQHWGVSAVRHRHQGVFPINFSADFVIMAAGPLSIPKLPNIDGTVDYEGKMFHTARWDWKVTGGSPDLPALDKLHNKRVAVIGTGATAVQVIPHLAEWSKELYVFQRTPSAVDERNNRLTDPDWWTKEVISHGPGWQRERMENFNEFVSNATNLPAVDLVDDEWSHARSYSALVGGPQNLHPEYLKEMEWIDVLRQDRIRQRVSRIVQDWETANLLKPYYSGWCKRPCFHDEYLQTFNRPNVQLVDTDGKGVVCISPTGVVSNESEYEVDVIVFATGYNVAGRTTPDERASTIISGRGNKTMRTAWKDGMATLHGLTTHDFPNLFFPGPSQAGISPNYTYFLDQTARHVSYILSHAVQKQNQDMYKVTVEPTLQAQEAWSEQTMARAGGLAGLTKCTPGYFNLEGKADEPKTMQDMIKAARQAHWGEGIMSWVKILEAWRAVGTMEGLKILRLKRASVCL